MKLYVDAGNTRTKWRLTDGREGAVASDDISGMEQSLVSLAGIVTGVFVCSVLGEAFNRRLEALCGQLFGVPPHFARVEQGVLDIVPAYERLDTLGVDRWLGLVFARSHAKRQCSVVVGAGSALTVDLLDAQARHLGGWIAPGCASVEAALGGKVQFARSEAYLKALQSDGALTPPQTSAFGSSTVACVQGGVDAMIRGFLQQVIACAGAEFGGREAVYFLAGGDSPRVEAMLRELDPNLKLVLSSAIVLDALVLWSEWCA